MDGSIKITAKDDKNGTVVGCVTELVDVSPVDRINLVCTLLAEDFFVMYAILGEPERRELTRKEAEQL